MSDVNNRLPFSFLEEVHPGFGGPAYGDQDLIDFDTEYVDMPPSPRKHHKRYRKWKEMPLDKFPPKQIFPPYDFGVMTGPPIADREFYNAATNELQPKDAQHPALGYGTRRSRHYKSHYSERAPHWRFESFANDGQTQDIRVGTIYSFLGHVALGIALIVIVAMLRNGRH